jgi:release factor glutamine methyltransferase
MTPLVSLTVAQTLTEAARILRQAGIPDERREAASLLGHVLGCTHTYLLTHPERLLTTQQSQELRALTQRRAGGEPFAYITGEREFYGLAFEVTPDVLIPRPETELLVDKALEIIRQRDTPAFICDVGTGSGCISIVLLHENPTARAIALDISPAAVQVARRNAMRHHLAERLELLESEGFAALAPKQQFDLIVSNPPYIPAATVDDLQREVRDHEPRQALTPGPEGLEMIRRLLTEAPPFLTVNGHLLLEIGFDQADVMRALINPQTWQLLDICQDLQGHPRTVILKKH